MRILFTGTLTGLLLMGFLWTSGCGQRAQRIDQPQRITTIEQIDIQDWEEAARDMLDSLFTRGPLRADRDQPTLLQVTPIRNETTDRGINTGHLTEYMLTELNRSRRAEAVRWREDDTLREQRDLEEFLREREIAVRQFDYTLGGRIIEERRRVGRTRQSTFVFIIWLNDPDTGSSIWQERMTIDKQGTRPAVGL